MHNRQQMHLCMNETADANKRITQNCVNEWRNEPFWHLLLDSAQVTTSILRLLVLWFGNCGNHLCH